ncbi:ATP-dependent RNA helicase, putative [Plasmodium ovale wallikeri]|uniref:ATP-dependent RNA helicase, putative n=1 Tax=Plasmodium ovale wallikeri TaxID=864142 RepID=A0A1A8YIC6_PLAOA|nr:ATP-dependent RNA helicase, putative [Plasmodium ovale wallikeri]SBT37458.1 ATP-dependent RNA helicase, putative [Plasmodium ovale wallikeri]
MMRARLCRYNGRRGTVYHFLKKKEKSIMMKSAKRRYVETIELLKFKIKKLEEIQSNLKHLKPIIKDAIVKENLEIIKRNKFYSYDELQKLNNA